MSTEHLGDVYFDRLSCGSFTPPAGCIGDAAIAPGAHISPTKLQARLRSVAGQPSGVNNLAQRSLLAFVSGAVGTLVAVYARNIVTATGGDSVSIQVLKNGVAILASPIVLDVAAGTLLQSSVSFTSTSVVAGDILEASITLSGTAVGQGASVMLVHDEDPV